MPESSSAENLATRRVQNTLALTRQEALRKVRAAKTDEINWGQAADAVLAELAGPGLPTEDAQ